MNPEDFYAGLRVRYIPTHAHLDTTHRDCRNGVVTSVNVHGTVFVKFPGDEYATACEPDQLLVRETS